MCARSTVVLCRLIANLLSSQYIVVHRVQPSTQKGYLLVAHTAYPPSRGSKDRGISEYLSRTVSLILKARQLNQSAFVGRARSSFLGPV